MIFSAGPQALDWLFSEGLIAVGTVVAYDDYWDLACKHASAEIEGYGEARAHLEMARKHQVKFQCICGPCAELPPRGDAPLPVAPWGWRTYFVVRSLGEGADSGMTMPTSDAKDFVAHHPTCRGLWDRNSTHWLGIQRRRARRRR